MDKLNVELLYAQRNKHRQRWVFRGTDWWCKQKLVLHHRLSDGIRTRASAEDLAKLQTWLDNLGDRWS
jgi:hypothetical protein